MVNLLVAASEDAPANTGKKPRLTLVGKRPKRWRSALVPFLRSWESSWAGLCLNCAATTAEGSPRAVEAKACQEIAWAARSKKNNCLIHVPYIHISPNRACLGGELFPHTVGVFCNHLEPPNCNIWKNQNLAGFLIFPILCFECCPNTSRDMKDICWRGWNHVCYLRFLPCLGTLSSWVKVKGNSIIICHNFIINA